MTQNSYYSPGDYVNLTCVSGPSKPPTILSWFINRKQITKHSSLPVNISKQLIDLTPNGLTSTSLNIVFQISGRFFQSKTGTIELACESILTTGKSLCTRPDGPLYGCPGVAYASRYRLFIELNHVQTHGRWLATKS